jgi:hypothetical protein
VSPKRQVALLVAIFATLGIGVSVGIVGAGGGFGSPFNFTNPPSSRDVFHIGQNINNGTTMTYALNSTGPSSSLVSATVVLKFVNESNDWAVQISVKNGTGQEQDGVQRMSSELTLIGEPSSSFKPYFDPIRLSIFSIRDMDYQGAEKYLYPGAPWNTIETGVTSVVARITGQETVHTQSGTYNAFVLSYKLASKTSKLWIDSKVPLPVKADVYDAYDNPQYKFELTSYTP